MTVEILTRQRGAVIRCNYHHCPRSMTTGQCQVKIIREYAKSEGWIRGLDRGSGSAERGGRPANRRWDVCPQHAVDERAKDVERKRIREEKRKARTEERARKQAAVTVEPAVPAPPPSLMTPGQARRKRTARAAPTVTP